jgi:hypothetical protein
MNYAPIVVFCYRRSVENLIDSLLLNSEASSSDLIIFSDGWKSEEDKKDVLRLRAEVESIKGFKSIQLNFSDNNKGLANSIISGVSIVLAKYDSVIVLEDDLLVSKYFLKFMNDGLLFHKKNLQIWSISGYSPKLSFLNYYKKDTYLSVRSSSWGWATWVDRWSKVDWNISDFKKLKNNKSQIEKFNLGGNDMFKMLELQSLGKIDSWAIRWSYSQFKNDSYSVCPKISMIVNNGFNDDKGVHNQGSGHKWLTTLSERPLVVERVNVNYKVINSFKSYHDLSLFTSIGYFLKKRGGYRIAKKMFMVLKSLGKTFKPYKQ